MSFDFNIRAPSVEISAFMSPLPLPYAVLLNSWEAPRRVRQAKLKRESFSKNTVRKDHYQRPTISQALCIPKQKSVTNQQTLHFGERKHEFFVTFRSFSLQLIKI